ncbi:D-glycero-alpha-D-manno-heptose-1,7-bisphosphate 7-phosphatase [Roseospira visakhapatnamensis]|uniref:D,D-heptose 1,7-bisphosphate phosphatase n=1 Tax=Roseospira visakhapatnamensis TaxID=390880 RepID=A0A7W6RBP6_9PROT|nr:HAD family hydrolase [Roseospira visakhapatnamensis]MBB4265470.1 D-glycero-D-manno-heptose 1,7-bisphosphate phosphatase [Roseospira visakhapatnamensis]
MSRLDTAEPEPPSAPRPAEAPTATPRPAAFLDRDGTLNVEVGYAHRPDQISWIDGAVAAIRRLNRAGWWVIVITNQAGVAYGYYDEETVRALHRWMTADLAARGARVDAFYYCPHHATRGLGRYRVACDCRKPGPGLLRQAMADFPVDPARSFILGDKPSDGAAGHALGIAGHLYRGGDLDTLVSRLMAESGA